MLKQILIVTFIDNINVLKKKWLVGLKWWELNTYRIYLILLDKVDLM